MERIKQLFKVGSSIKIIRKFLKPTVAIWTGEEISLNLVLSLLPLNMFHLSWYLSFFKTQNKPKNTILDSTQFSNRGGGGEITLFQAWGFF